MFQLDTYSRLVRWISKATPNEAKTKSGYRPTLKRLAATVHQHRTYSSLSVKDARAAISIRLSRSQSLFAFALYWFYISDVTRFIPTDEKFSKWELPHLSLEWDHLGKFSEIATQFCDVTEITTSGAIHYEGGETKGSYKCTVLRYLV